MLDPPEKRDCDGGNPHGRRFRRLGARCRRKQGAERKWQGLFWSWLFPFIGFLECCKIKFLHRQECLREPINLLTRAVCHHLANRRWPDLPGKTKLIFEPATLFSVWICRKLFPIVID